MWAMVRKSGMVSALLQCRAIASVKQPEAAYS
jgi:hypothetical protein